MQKEVHAGDGGRGEVLFVSEKLTPERPVVAVALFHMMNRFDQHAACATRRIKVRRIDRSSQNIRGLPKVGL